MYTFGRRSTCSLFLWASLFWVLNVAPAYALHAKNVKPALTKLKNHIQAQVQKKRIPGCAVAVIYQNEVVFIDAFGVKKIGSPEKINTETMFQLGSVSKPIAASLLSVLETQKILKLEDPVNHYLSRFSLKGVKYKKSLKIKHILSHSTGVPRAGFNNLIESQTPYEKIRTTLQRTPIRTGIGKRYDYNNAMYGLISDITKSATKTSFTEVLKSKLLKPLGMTKTSSTLDGLLNDANRATPHVHNRRGALIPCSTYSKGYYTVAPAGGINSNIKDMSIFLKAQLGGYPGVLSRRALSKIQTPQIPTNDVLSSSRSPKLITNAHYALGWRVTDFSHHKLVFHGGWLKGFTNFIGFIPEHDIGIVILHNGESKFSANTAVSFFEDYLGIVPQKKITAKKKIKKRATAKKAKRTPPKKATKIKRYTIKKPQVQRIKIKRIVTPPDSK